MTLQYVQSKLPQIIAKWAKSITDDQKSGSSTSVSTSKTKQAGKDLTRSDESINIDKMAPNVVMSHCIMYANVRDKLNFTKVSLWIFKMLTEDHKTQRLMSSRVSLAKIEELG